MIYASTICLLVDIEAMETFFRPLSPNLGDLMHTFVLSLCLTVFLSLVIYLYLFLSFFLFFLFDRSHLVAMAQQQFRPLCSLLTRC
jgi:hypothetical protein